MEYAGKSMRTSYDFDMTYIDEVTKKTIKEKIYNKAKRITDVTLSSAALVALSPVFLVTAVAIKLDSKGPVFYSQERVGKDFKIFKMYKFRSMCIDADEMLDQLQALNEKTGPTFKIKNDPRVTKVGKIIRKLSIDELPQLINIIKGDMAIVGPRPALIKEVEQFTPEQLEKLTVPQGLTCIWQIEGRDNPDFEYQIRLDKEYIKRKGFLFDIKLILLTIPSVINGKTAC